MVSDFNNVNNQLVIPADLFKQNRQPPVLGKNSENSRNSEFQQFPSDAKIEELVASALDYQKKGNIIERGSILNILV